MAENDAALLQSAHRRFFLDMPVKVSSVMRALGISVSRDATLREEAVVERHHHAAHGDRYRVRIQPGLPADRGRLLLAHELGHIVLSTRHAKESALWNRQTRERFANTFARELIVPVELREQISTEFLKLRTPSELVRVSGRWGLLPTTLIRFASSHPEWTAGSRTIWLIVKNSANIYSGLDIRLRVRAAAFDRRRWFIPTNQSLSAICQDQEWLTMVQPGRDVTKVGLEANLSALVETGTPKYRKVVVESDWHAFRLREATADGRGFFLLSILPLEANG